MVLSLDLRIVDGMQLVWFVGGKAPNFLVQDVGKNLTAGQK
jgi:hypothetical protein